MSWDVNHHISGAMKFRFDCQSFDVNEKISKEDIETILEVAYLSPSSFGFEPWKFLVLQNKKIREEITEFVHGARSQILTCSHFIVILARKSIDVNYDAKYVDHILKDVQKLSEDVINEKHEEIKKFQMEDFDLKNDRTLFDWACKQTYIPLGAIILASALFGIDSSPAEGFNREHLEEYLANKNLLDREHFGVSVLITLGYRDSNLDICKKTRGEKEEIIKWIE